MSKYIYETLGTAGFQLRGFSRAALDNVYMTKVDMYRSLRFSLPILTRYHYLSFLYLEHLQSITFPRFIQDYISIVHSQTFFDT